MISQVATYGERLGISQYALTIAEKVDLRDIDYRHTERMSSGTPSFMDSTYAADNARWHELNDLATKRKQAGVCVGTMSVYRCLERNGRAMRVSELVPMAGAGSPTTCRKYLKTLMGLGMIVKSPIVRGGYEIS